MVQNNFFYVARSEYWAYFLKSQNADKMIMKNVNEFARGNLFNEYVQEVVIETSAFCNRRCVYCPVAEHPREQRFMSATLYEKILTEMRQIDYRGIFTLSLFNEPLAHRDILKRIVMAKEYCPQCYVRMNSNGDYLTREYLDELNEVGLDEILITQHMNPGEKYTDEVAETKIRTFFERVGLEYEITKKSSLHNISCDMIYKGIRLLVVTNNWEEDGNDRGGAIASLSKRERIEPCCTPFREIFIDVDGEVRYCFNIFVNEKSLANVADTNILDVFFGDEMVDIRRAHLAFGLKEGACRTCNTPDNALLESQSIREKMMKRL